MRSILNAKFCVLFVELIIVGCIFFTKYENIAASSSNTDYNTMVQYINGFVVVTLVMIGLQMVASMMGIPFSRGLIPYQSNLQIIGLFCYGCFILMRMQYTTISYIWGVFCLIPFLIDLVSAVAQLIRNRKYSKLDSS